MNKNQSVKDFLQAGDEIELMVDDYGYHGEGIGHWQGQAIFIPQALKGEKVKVQILKVKKNFAQGLLKEVLSYHREDKNPRTAPSCPYYDLCGGCQLQHMVYEEQLFLKSNLLYNNLRRLAGLDRSELADILPSPEVLHYRN
ncbi:MAG: TRAM domain-containing protein, partial [Clostridiales bacterium]